jgi:hypothetical protein
MNAKGKMDREEHLSVSRKPLSLNGSAGVALTPILGTLNDAGLPRVPPSMYPNNNQ